MPRTKLVQLFSVDTRSLALLRIGLGAALLTDLALRDRYLEWLCGEMNRAASPDEAVLSLEMELHYRVLNPSTGPGALRVTKLAARDCAAPTKAQ